jgi:hypothetical protein
MANLTFCPDFFNKPSGLNNTVLIKRYYLGIGPFWIPLTLFTSKTIEIGQICLKNMHRNFYKVSKEKKTIRLKIKIWVFTQFYMALTVFKT